MKHTLRRSLLLACIAGAACGGDDGGGPIPPPENKNFSAAGGAGQSAIAGTTVPVPYTVQVTDSAGVPLSGVTIHWAVGSVGTVSAITSVTDTVGRASVLHTLGGAAGTQTVSASIDGFSGAPVVFSTAALAAAQAVRVAARPIPPSYGIHDTFVRDGLAFVSAWDTGLIIYDVGTAFVAAARAGQSRYRASCRQRVPPATWWVRSTMHGGSTIP